MPAIQYSNQALIDRNSIIVGEALENIKRGRAISSEAANLLGIPSNYRNFNNTEVSNLNKGLSTKGEKANKEGIQRAMRNNYGLEQELATSRSLTGNFREVGKALDIFKEKFIKKEPSAQDVSIQEVLDNQAKGEPLSLEQSLIRGKTKSKIKKPLAKQKKPRVRGR
jgi:hypothetical protein